MTQKIDLEQLCAEKGLRITEQRRVIAKVLSESDDHPDVELLHSRASAIDPGISIATVYRTVRLFEEAGILDRHDFGDGSNLGPPRATVSRGGFDDPRGGTAALQVPFLLCF